jgi:hypothetical protein
MQVVLAMEILPINKRRFKSTVTWYVTRSMHISENPFMATAVRISDLTEKKIVLNKSQPEMTDVSRNVVLFSESLSMGRLT